LSAGITDTFVWQITFTKITCLQFSLLNVYCLPRAMRLVFGILIPINEPKKVGRAFHGQWGVDKSLFPGEGVGNLVVPGFPLVLSLRVCTIMCRDVLVW
jgi:hypothetical protein